MLELLAHVAGVVLIVWAACVVLPFLVLSTGALLERVGLLSRRPMAERDETPPPRPTTPRPPHEFRTYGPDGRLR